MITAEQLLARLNGLRQEFSDDKEDETYLTLHHAMLFISYQMAAFKQYMQEAQKTGNQPKK